MIKKIKDKDISDISLRDENEFYIGDIVQIKMPKWLNVKNALVCGYNSYTNKWIVKYTNTKSNIKYDEVDEEYIVKIKETTIEINPVSKIHKYDKELFKYLQK